MSASNLPLLRNLPSWSRVGTLDRVGTLNWVGTLDRVGTLNWAGTLDRACYPPIVSCECKDKAAPAERHSYETTETSAVMDKSGPRVDSLEKDILFLQQTHKSTLEKLHEEIDQLKRANRELQYQLIMGAHVPPKETKSGDSHEKQCQTEIISSPGKPENRHYGVGQKKAIIMSLLPLRIQDGPSQPSRTPTLQECERMIRQLHDANALQAHESPHVLLRFPDAGEEKHCGLVERHQTRVSVNEKVILPSIRQALSSNLTERQKRAQDVHKMRLRRPIFS
ncbi:Coiled-coil domain-containing protein 74B [Bagarius yarrelli]|uniref:Coiled-coil domain-containing protein 74B n=1 Tax=Bagarius yarrelli TaxID=175774 RepID=A0A556VCI5_BAGYA|nr:Coiled-coil domain-containing protein 74B [Bagarius yarrelli]